MSNRFVLAGWRRRWNRNLLRFLGSRMRHSIDIEDVAQETYLRLLRAPDLREVRNPEAYLIRVASHVIAEWRHSQPSAETLTAIDADAQLVDERTPDFELDSVVIQEQFEQALATLPAAMRAVLLLKLRDDRSSKEIARVLELTDRQVKRHLARGYERLRQALQR
jgi:RNA polymerase sigma factor (sigma-70 family)